MVIAAHSNIRLCRAYLLLRIVSSVLHQTAGIPTAPACCSICPYHCCAVRKDWVEEDVVDKTWYKPGSGTAVPYLPLLVGVVLAMLATTVFVVSKTS